MPPDEIKEFRREIPEAGRHFVSASSACFPDAERVSNAIEKVLNVVKDFKLVGMWVTSHSHASNTEEGYATTEESCQVSFCVFSLLINAMRDF